MSSCPPYINVPGVAGNSAFTFVTANFLVPTIGSNVAIAVLDTSWMVVGENVIVAAPANFQIISVDSPTQFTGQFLGLTGDVTAASTISLGAQVSPVGQPGTPGTNGNNGYTTTTSNFTVPSIGSTVVVPVVNTAAFVVGENVIATGPANFKVTAIGGATSITLMFLGNTGDVSVGSTITSGATITSAGSAGTNAFTTLTAQLTIPATGSTVTASVVNSQWMAIGQKVVIDGPATFQVYSKPTTTSAVLTFLGYFGDLAAGNVIANGATVSPAGTQPSAGTTIYGTLSSPAAITQGSPAGIGLSITLSAAGQYQLTAVLDLQYSIDYNGYNGVNPVTLSFQRTNNTPLLLNSLVIYPIPNNLATLYGYSTPITFQIVTLVFTNYSTTNTTDQIAIYASFPNALTAGNISVISANMIAQQIA